MDDLKASYKDDTDIESMDTAPPPLLPPPSAVVDERKDHIEPDSEPETEHQVSSDEVEVLSEDNDNNPREQNDQIAVKKSPNFARISDTDEDEEEYEEEPPAKKQKQVGEISNLEESPLPVTPVAAEIGENPSETLTTIAGNKSSASKSATKKAKKKSKDVWTRPTSRKGKKKKNNGHHNGNSNGDESDKVLITPVLRFPDKNDDNPDASICLSKVHKAEKVELSEDRLSAGSIKGYRMVRATRGVTEGSWYFEIKVVHLGETGHTRLGWSLDKGDLQAPVGYDGNSFGYRDIDGCKVHKAIREKYAEEGYKAGDVLGFYINLPDGKLYEPPPARLVWYKGQRYATSGDTKEEPPKVVPGSEISFFKNGVCQGTAYTDLFGGRYYPAASMYTLPNQPNCTVKFNFGPNFEFCPQDFGGRPIPKPMSEVPYHAFDAGLENGSAWKSFIMCPVLTEVVGQGTKIVVDAQTFT